jgi:deoxyribodipyrimidine photo-lyase
MACNVIWFRRDLRLADHEPLIEGCRRGAILPLFILDPALLNHPETAPARVAFLLECLRSLDGDLRRRGGRLVVRRGDPVEELVRVVKASGADGVIAHTDSERIVGRIRDAAVNRRLASEGMAIRWIEPAGACGDLRSYPAWSRRWHAAMAEPAPAAPPRVQLPPSIGELADLPLPDLEALGLRPDGKPLPSAGSAAALERLERFCEGPASRTYYWELSYPSARVTSGLSPYLKFGAITARQCLQRLAPLAGDEGGRRRSALQLASRLRWAAAIHQRFRYLPQLELRSLWRSYDGADEHDPADAALDAATAELYAAWREGRTGFPIVDAAARCLQAEGGWLELNFRSRAIHASFLTHLCGIDWRWGALHFMRHLIDGDCPIDHYQWAMQAGVTAGGPGGWARIYHPGQVAVNRCDPQGLFIRRWLPELAGLTNDQLGCPPLMADYPRPILDYETARQRRLTTLERRRAQLEDPRRELARLPGHYRPFAADLSDAVAMPELFPTALDPDALEPGQWDALLSWFQLSRRGADRAPSAAGSRRRRPRRPAPPGQLSLDLGIGDDVG